MISGNINLLQKIRERIEREGPISFRNYMEMALYDPSSGYYMSKVPKIGKEGDFYTSPDVHPLFGKLLARQIAEMAGSVPGLDSGFDLVEAGPGKGLLMYQILKELKKGFYPVYEGLRGYLIETSPYFKEVQQALFESDSELRLKVNWIDSLDRIAPVQGIVYSNEFFDAFPVHRVIWKGELKEIYVNFRNGLFCEEIGPLSNPGIVNYFIRYPVPWIEDQQAEVSLDAAHWILNAGRAMKCGFVMTIDYGERHEALYSVKRKKGTLIGYRNHRTSENPYENIGQQDITSHLNFSAIGDFGAEGGLDVLGLVDLSRFLIGLGLVNEMERYAGSVDDPSRDAEYRAMKFLIHPDGLGPVFKILIQKKGLDSPRLSGLRYLRGG